MSVIQEALEKAKESVLQEAKEALALLQSQADEKVQQAVMTLEGLVTAWEESASRLNGLGLSSIAEISLRGGMAWTLHDVGPSYAGSLPLLGFLRNCLDSSQYQPYQQFYVPSSASKYDIFFLIVPVELKEEVNR